MIRFTAQAAQQLKPAASLLQARGMQELSQFFGTVGQFFGTDFVNGAGLATRAVATAPSAAPAPGPAARPS
jgi:hypothetical protein